MISIDEFVEQIEQYGYHNHKELPDNLTVGGGLYLSNTEIKELPDNLTVGGNLYLSNTEILYKESEGSVMLKIKDGIDLKELEKFGFENQINTCYYKQTQNSNQEYETGIIVNPINAKIENEIVYYTNNTEDITETLYEDDLDLSSNIDILYDLIQARISRESRGVEYERNRI